MRSQVQTEAFRLRSISKHTLCATSDCWHVVFVVLPGPAQPSKASQPPHVKRRKAMLSSGLGTAMHWSLAKRDTFGGLKHHGSEGRTGSVSGSLSSLAKTHRNRRQRQRYKRPLSGADSRFFFHAYNLWLIIIHGYVTTGFLSGRTYFCRLF